MNRTLRALLAVPAIALLAASCGSSDSDDAATTTTAAEAPAAETPEEDAPATDAALTMRDAWVKASNEEKTGAFGVTENQTDADVVIASASTEAASMVELHETVEDPSGEMVMRAKDGGFVVPAGGELVLEPGGDHIMLMGLTGPIAAGEAVAIELVTEDGETLVVEAVAKDFSGANERYTEHE